MVAEVTGVLIDTVTALGASFVGVVNDVFGEIIYNATTGLTDFATWALIFGAGAIMINLLSRLVRRV